MLVHCEILIISCHINETLTAIKRGYRLVRSAAGGNLYVWSVRAGERVMASVSRFLDKKLKLKVNRGKRAVARPGERQFSGFIHSVISF